MSNKEALEAMLKNRLFYLTKTKVHYFDICPTKYLAKILPCKGLFSVDFFGQSFGQINVNIYQKIGLNHILYNPFSIFIVFD